MSEFRARIGRVRMKNGGADVHVLHRQAINPDGDDWRGAILTAAKGIAELATDDRPLSGFFIAGLFADGSTSTGFRYDPDQCAIPRAAMPAWFAEVVRRDIITAPEAKDVFNDMFEWRDA